MTDAMHLDAATPTTGAQEQALEICLYPLVLMSLSDHCTRVQYKQQSQGGSSSSDGSGGVFGVLLGTQKGRQLELAGSFEVMVKAGEKGEVVIDDDYLTRKASSMLKNVFKDSVVVGWYSTGKDILPYHVQIQKMMVDLYDSALLLLLDASISKTDKELPIKVLEGTVQGGNVTFAQVTYKIETQEAERIAVDHIAHVQAGSTETADSSHLASHLSNLHSAVSMLCQRTDTLGKYLDGVESGTIPKDRHLIRQIVALCNQLPTVNTQAFKQEFDHEFSDNLAIGYLAAMTAGCATTNDIIDKYNVAFESFGPSSRRFHKSAF